MIGKGQAFKRFGRTRLKRQQEGRLIDIWREAGIKNAYLQAKKETEGERVGKTQATSGGLAGLSASRAPQNSILVVRIRGDRGTAMRKTTKKKSANLDHLARDTRVKSGFLAEKKREI